MYIIEFKKAVSKSLADRYVPNIENSQKSYTIGKNVTIDEKREGFRTKCSFRQYIPSKLFKYEVKMYALVDAKFFYTQFGDI